MSDLASAFIAELHQEASGTRALLERVPEEHTGWRPHPKSMTLGRLAFHIASMPAGVADLLTPAVSELPDVRLPERPSRAEILQELERSISVVTQKLEQWGDDGLLQMWRMQRDGRTLLELPRIAMVRSVIFNHWYHHRGQLTVYLRMHDVALPPLYGPTADVSVF